MKAFSLGALFLYRMLRQTPDTGYSTTVMPSAALPDHSALQKMQPVATSRGDIVLLHGMSSQGSQDPRILKLARVIASLGFTVWLPHFDEIANHEIRRDVFSRLNAMLLHLKSCIAGPLAIMAPSYSATIALTLAGQPQTYVPIDALCCIGVFVHFNRFLASFHDGDNADLYGRAISLKNLLITQRRLSATLHHTFEQIFQNLHDHQDKLVDIHFDHLDLKEQAALKPLLQADQWHTIREALWQKGLLFEQPVERMPNTATKLAFIHGINDTLASAHDIKPFVAHLSTTQCRVSITGLMDHSAFLYKIHQLPTLLSLVNTFGFFFNHAIAH